MGACRRVTVGKLFKLTIAPGVFLTVCPSRVTLFNRLTLKSRKSNGLLARLVNQVLVLYNLDLVPASVN